MRTNKQGRGISFGLIAAPCLIFIAIAIGFAVFVFWQQDSFFFASYHKDRLFGSISHKKMLIDNWFQDTKGDLEGAASIAAIREYVSIAREDAEKLGAKQRRHVLEQREQARSKALNTLLEKTSTGKFSLLSLISKEGTVLVSTSSGLAGHSMADIEVFRNAISKATKPLFIGFWKDNMKGYELDITTPVKDDKGEITAFLHGAVNTSPLLSILSSGSSNAMSFELVDKEGNVLISSKGAVSSAKRYSTQFISSTDQMLYHEGSVFSSVQIRELNLFLVATAQSYQLFYPLIETALIYCSLILLMLILFIYQALYLRRKVSKPLNKLLGDIRSSTAGVQTVSIQKSYPAEIDNLFKAVRQMIDDFVMRKPVSIPHKIAHPESVEMKAEEAITLHKGDDETEAMFLLFQGAALDTRDTLLQSLHKLSDQIDDANAPELLNITQSLMRLYNIIDNYGFLSSLKEKGLKGEETYLLMDDIFYALSKEMERLGSLTGIECIIDNDSTLSSQKIDAPKSVIMQILKNLLTNSFSTTDSGTITVVSSCKDNGDGSQAVVFYVSDTGTGYDAEEIELIKKAGDGISPALSTAFMLAEKIGAMISLESIKGKGSVTTFSFGRCESSGS